MMQLTKDDVKTYWVCPSCGDRYLIICPGLATPGTLELEKHICNTCGKISVLIKELNFSKFLEVRAFYEKYKDNEELLYKEQHIGFSSSISTGRKDWFKDRLFSYCFVEGLR